MKLPISLYLFSFLLVGLHSMSYTEMPTTESPKQNRVISMCCMMTTMAKEHISSLMDSLGLTFGNNEDITLEDKACPTTNFDTVIGLHNAKQYIRKLLTFIQDPEVYYTKTGDVPPQGVLLYGLPGTGKTFFVEAMVGEIKKFFADSSQEVRIYHFSVGDIITYGMKAIMDHMENDAPCIISIDAIDTLLSTGQYKLLKELSIIMQGRLSMDPGKQVVVIAETNRIEKCTYQFGKPIECTLPTAQERREFLEKRLSKIAVAVSHSDLENTALLADGWTCAQLDWAIDSMIKKAKDYGIPVNQLVLDDIIRETILCQTFLDADDSEPQLQGL